MNELTKSQNVSPVAAHGEDTKPQTASALKPRRIRPIVPSIFRLPN